MMILNCVYHTARYFSLGSQYLSVGIERMAPSPTFAANLFADAPVTPGIAWPCWQSGNGEVKKEVEDLASKHIFFLQLDSCFSKTQPIWEHVNQADEWCRVGKVLKPDAQHRNQTLIKLCSTMFNRKKCYILEFIHWPHNAKLRKWHPRSQIAVV